MPKIYCSNCGNAIEYSSAKPNFCQKCGTNLNPNMQQRQATPQPQIEIEIKNTKPIINNLNWDIEVKRPRGEKLKDLAKGEKHSIEQRSNEGLSRDEFLKQFQREAGTLRRGNQSHQAADDDYDDEIEDS